MQVEVYIADVNFSLWSIMQVEVYIADVNFSLWAIMQVEVSIANGNFILWAYVRAKRGRFLLLLFSASLRFFLHNRPERKVYIGNVNFYVHFSLWTIMQVEVYIANVNFFLWAINCTYNDCIL